MKPADLVHVQTPDSPALAPDRRSVVFVLRRVDGDGYAGSLWRVPADGSAPPEPFLQGRADSCPKFSPDGRWIAFLRADGGPPQLHVVPAGGGQPRAVTTAQTHPLGVEGPVWSPGSDRIAYIARIAEAGRYGTAGPAADPPRLITEPKYRRDGQGFLDRPGQVHVIDPYDGDPVPVRLTAGEFDNTGVAWSPDGRRLVFASARHPQRHRTMNGDVFVIGVDGTGLRQLTGTDRTAERPAFSADGTQVYFAGAELGACGYDWFANQTGAFVVPVDGHAPPRRLSDAERFTLDGHFGPGLGGLLFASQRQGAVELLRFAGDGNADVVIGGDRQVRAVDTVGDTVVAVVTDPMSAGDLVLIDGTGERTLTAYGAALRALVRVLPMTELTGAAPDGYPVHGWLVTPPGDGPHPVALLVHGGPFAQYGWTLFDEAQVYAEAGYAVVLGNPRGSSGYGHRHGRHVVGDVGARSAPDLLALLDVALRDPALDASRVAVLGGSHGGYMVGWLLAHTDRFRGGVSERSINAVDSLIATSDIGWAFRSLYGDDPAGYARQSPLTYADRITAPVLIIHSEDDLRCPMEQAQRLFFELFRLGRPVELLLFPGGGHELSRSGRPNHRIARFEAILDWLARHV
ncbi:S9 family peptidase [Dactylosporangium sp. NPDC050588]|uniref:S9 family peptidase n=1 Tax=Dactylosporangium sp. NPDC050588 TaxID=3157211 RepID=UPI00340B6B07